MDKIDNNNKLDKVLFGRVTLRSVITFVIAVLTFAAISWIYFYPNDVNGDVLRQSDVMQGTAIGQEAKVFHEATGEVTLWTNSLFGGMPTFQISPSYDSTSMLSWVGNVWNLHFPQPVGWVFVLMLGFYLLMLSFGLKWYVGLIGAIAYGFSSYFFILIGAGHIWKLLTLAYIPPTLAGIVWAYRGHYLGGAALAALFAALQLMSNHVQMTYYSLFVVVALAMAFLVKAIIDKKGAQWCIATGALLVAAALAVGANAPNLYLTYKYSKETIRGGHSDLTPEKSDAKGAPQQQVQKNGGLDKDYITQWSYGIDETFTLLAPNVKGGASLRPQAGENVPMTLADTPKAKKLEHDGKLDYQDQQNLQYFLQYFGDQPMTNGPVYVGAVIFALFLLGCFVVKGPVKWALLAVTLLSVFLSWGHNMMWLTDIFIDYFPMYNKFRTVSSILVIAELTMPLLACLALHQVLSEPDFLAKHKRATLAAFGISAGLCLVFAIFPSIFGTFSQQETEAYINSGQLQQVPSLSEAIATIRHSMVSSDAWRSFGFIVVAFGIIFAFASGKVKASPAVTGVVMAALVLVDMFAVNKRYINKDTFVSHFDIKPAATFTKRPADVTVLADTTQNYRVLDQQHFSEAMPSYFHKAVGGYHAAKLTRYNDLIERQISKGNIQVLNMLNTRWVIVNDNQAQQNPEALGNAWFVDSLTYVATPDEEMKFLDKFNAATSAVADAKFKNDLGEASAKQAGDTIRETTYAPNKLTYHAHSAKGGVAVFSEVYFPWGWKATIDGKEAPIGRVNYVLRALRLPAGDHTVVFTFDPQEVHTTDTVAKGSIAAIFVGLIAAGAFTAMRRKDGKKQAADEAKKA